MMPACSMTSCRIFCFLALFEMMLMAIDKYGLFCLERFSRAHQVGIECPETKAFPQQESTQMQHLLLDLVKGVGVQKQFGSSNDSAILCAMYSGYL